MDFIYEYKEGGTDGQTQIPRFNNATNHPPEAEPQKDMKKAVKVTAAVPNSFLRLLRSTDSRTTYLKRFPLPVAAFW